MSEVGPIQLEFDYTFEDYREAFIAQQRSLQSSRRRHGWIAWVLIALIVALVLLLYNLRMRGSVMVPPAAAPMPATPAPIVAPPESLLQTLSRVFVPMLPWLFIVAVVALVLRRAAKAPPPHRPVEQYVHVSRWTSLRTGLTIGLLLVALVVAWILLRRMTSRSAPRGSHGFADLLLQLTPWLVLFLFIWMFVFRGMTNLNIERLWAGQPALQLRKRMTIGDEGVKVSDAFSRHETQWQAFRRFIETPNLFLLMFGDYSFHMIPKRALSDDEVTLLRHLLRSRIQAQTNAFPVIPITQAIKS